MDLFENFLQGKMSFEEVSSAMRTILHRLQGLEVATDAYVDEISEDSDVIFIDVYGGDASFKEV